MRSVVSIWCSIMVLFLCAVPLFGQQSTTDTNCNVNGQQVNCTSNTTSTGSTDVQRAEQQREMNEAGKAVGSAVGSLIGNKILKHRIDKWCGGHPDGSWNFSNGQNVTCWNWNEAYQPAANTQLRAQRTEQATTIAVAAWTFCSTHPDQSWTGPISGKVTPCGQLIALADATCSRNPGLDSCKAIGEAKIPASTSASVTAPSASASPAEKAKDYCSRNPTMTWYVGAQQSYVSCEDILAAPPSSVTATFTPALTPEQKEAVSYCKRNPTATVTWNNGTVSPCSSVLDPQ
jgi:hypothetical protein